MDASLQNNIERWTSSGEAVLHFKDKLHSASQTQETDAVAAFMRLYYHIGELQPGEIERLIGILNKRRSNLSDLKLKKSLGDFLSVSTIMASSPDDLRQAVAFMKREGTLPFDDSEARRRNEENQRRIREEAERRRREEEERRRREEEQRRQREEEQRRRQEEERRRRETEERRRRQEEEARRQQQDGQRLEAEVDRLNESMRQYVILQAKKKGKWGKSLKNTFWILLIAGIVYGLIELGVFGGIRDWIQGLTSHEEQRQDYSELLTGEWTGHVGDGQGSLEFLSAGDTQVEAKIHMKYSRLVTHNLMGEILEGDSIIFTDLQPDKFINGKFRLHLEGDEKEVLNGFFVATKTGRTLPVTFYKYME